MSGRRNPLARRAAVGWLVPLALIALVVLAGELDDPQVDRDRSDPNASAPDAAAEEIRARVVRIVDGDTIVVRIAGTDERVRYIGVDTPETVHPEREPECFGAEASALNRSLVEGRTVRLRFDREPRDRFGRMLAYVFAGDTHVNAELVRLGAARPLRIEPNTGFAERFARLARSAASAGRGIWGAC